MSPDLQLIDGHVCSGDQCCEAAAEARGRAQRRINTQRGEPMSNQDAELERCGCPDDWLAEYPSDARDRRITGCQVTGDHHLTPDSGVHVWDGTRWLATEGNPSV